MGGRLGQACSYEQAYPFISSSPKMTTTSTNSFSVRIVFILPVPIQHPTCHLQATSPEDVFNYLAVFLASPCPLFLPTIIQSLEKYFCCGCNLGMRHASVYSVCTCKLMTQILSLQAVYKQLLPFPGQKRFLLFCFTKAQLNHLINLISSHQVHSAPPTFEQ